MAPRPRVKVMWMIMNVKGAVAAVYGGYHGHCFEGVIQGWWYKQCLIVERANTASIVTLNTGTQGNFGWGLQGN